MFSRDVTAAMLVSLNKEMAAMLVSPINPPGIELFYHANVFFSFGGKTRLLITSVKTLYYKVQFQLDSRIHVHVQLYSLMNGVHCYVSRS